MLIDVNITIMIDIWGVGVALVAQTSRSQSPPLLGADHAESSGDGHGAFLHLRMCQYVFALYIQCLVCVQ